MYYMYVLYSKIFDEIYIGQTNNIENRLNKHNKGLVSSTKRYIPWYLVHTEIFNSRADAMKREKELKTHKGRDFIRQLVTAMQLPD